MAVFLQMNALAWIAAALAAMAIGFLWYSPVLFGSKWRAASGMTKEQVSAGMKGVPMAIILGAICQLVIGYGLLHFIIETDVLSASEAIELAFIVWLSFFAAPSFHAVVWEKKPIAYWAINAGYQLAVFAVMGVILALWR